MDLGQDTSRGEPVWISSGRVSSTVSSNMPACSVRIRRVVTNAPERDDSVSHPLMLSDRVTSAVSPPPIVTC